MPHGKRVEEPGNCSWRNRCEVAGKRSGFVARIGDVENEVGATDISQ